jgi:hypothetical protein
MCASDIFSLFLHGESRIKVAAQVSYIAAPKEAALENTEKRLPFPISLTSIVHSLT